MVEGKYDSEDELSKERIERIRREEHRAVMILRNEQKKIEKDAAKLAYRSKKYETKAQKHVNIAFKYKDKVNVINTKIKAIQDEIKTLTSNLKSPDNKGGEITLIIKKKEAKIAGLQNKIKAYEKKDSDHMLKASKYKEKAGKLSEASKQLNLEAEIVKKRVDRIEQTLFESQ
jgi:chromosome segregation ATPase